MAASGVNVSVEAVLENQVKEVTLDGQEKYVQPCSMSENLSRLASKIDFYKDESEEKGKPTSEGEKAEEEDKSVTAFQPTAHPLDSVRNKLRAAFMELGVLLDVLSITKEKRYIAPDPVLQETTSSNAAQMLSKKKALQGAASVLISGAERLKKGQVDIANRGQNDFHFELLKLRQNWKLKKVGKTILGDLSYRSAGSRFWQGGTFEVIKSTDHFESEPGSQKSSLEVIVPSELEGVAYIQVEVKTVPDMMDLTSATLKMPAGLGSVRSDAYWQEKLEVSQNVLFCKELFAQLAREAVQVKSSTPHMVVGNQIITNVFPGIQLSIVLCHYTGKEKKVPLQPQKLEHNHVLEHSLHQLLREMHFHNTNLSPPHPVNAMLGMTRKRRLAGPEGMSRDQLASMSTGQALLEQIIKQTKHAVLRLWTMHVIDQLAVSVQDPQVTAHWTCLNSSLESNVRINITSFGYENVRTSLGLMVGVDTIQAILKDGRTCSLSFEDKELQDLILWQISQYHITVVQQLIKYQAWQILSMGGNMGTSDMETFGTASSIMLASPRGDIVLALKSGPSSDLVLNIKYVDSSSQSNLSTIIKDPKWSSFASTFKQINLDQLEGRNFASKMDMLMAELTTIK